MAEVSTWASSRPSNPAEGFDRVARIYQTMEYLSFGRALERCRFFFLPRLAEARHALVLGDGDGRFVARLLESDPALHAEAVDGSPAMLRLLRARVDGAGAVQRLSTACADLRGFSPEGDGYDLVATHFFLDCLTDEETRRLMERVRPRLAPGARWVVSEFEVPQGNAVRAGVCRLTIAGLYAAFRLMAGLRVRQIPRWREALADAGFVQEAERRWLGGLLVSELWRATASAAQHSHMEVASLPVLDTPGPLPGIDPGPEPMPGIPPAPEPKPAPGPPPEPDPQPYPGPIPAPSPVT